MANRAACRTIRLGGFATAFVVACALIPPEGAMATTSEPPTPAEVDTATAPAPEVVADWREPTASTQASATEIVDGALKESGKKPTSDVKIVSVIKKAGKPVIKTQVAGGAVKAKQVVAKAQADPRLLSVEVDSRTTHVLGQEVGDLARAPKAPGAESTNDPYWGSMWGLTRLNAETAWATTRGSPSVKVAVVDTGVASHVDLPTGQILAGADKSGDGGANGRSDGHGHGTHVAGTIVASVNNSVGVAGLAPNVTILPVKVLRSDGYGSDSGVAQGIIYAADQGADVISMSLGGGYSSTIATATAYAISKGSLPIAAAGNSRESGSPVSYPAALPGVLSVAATASNDSYAYFSNAGTYVDIAAPGQGIWSTLPGNQYAAWSGTSMATPHVSAVAALVMSRAAELTASSVPIDILLTSTADDLGPPGWDVDYGAGMVDPVGALAALGTPSESAPAAPAIGSALQVSDQGATITWVASSAGGTNREFVVTAEPGSVSCIAAAPATSCRITGLSSQTQYTASVAARNLGGTSASSDVVSFTTTARLDAASDDFATPTPIVPGVAVNEIIDSANDLDHWTFTAPADGIVQLSLTNLPLDYDLFLYDTNGAVKGYSWYYGTTSESIQASLPAGRYIALVQPYGNSGSNSPYRLMVTVPATLAPPATPTPPSAPTPPPPATSLARTIKVKRNTVLPKRADTKTLVWVNKSPGKCSLSGRRVTGKKVGTCRVNAYAVGHTSLGVRVKATIKVSR